MYHNTPCTARQGNIIEHVKHYQIFTHNNIS